MAAVRAFGRIREVAYDSAVFHGRGFEARYSTNTGRELRIRGSLDGLDPEAFEGIDIERYALLWGLANFGKVFAPLLPVRLVVRALSLESAEEDRWRSWMIGVVAEGLYDRGLPAELDLTFSGPRLLPRESGRALGEGAILMCGGGKDSVVSGELLKHLGVPFTWYSIREERSPAALELARISEVPLILSGISRPEVRRRFGRYRAVKPERLARWSGSSGDTGDGRPLLRWLSLTGPVVEACLVAEATGARFVLTGNDRSANEGNGIRIGDLEVNHQYTKSWDLEREYAPFLARYLNPELRYASLLMPFYELQIGKLFASLPQYFSVFRSCNRRTAERRWCGECPKCAFVYLLLSAFIDEETVTRIFGADLLIDPRLVPTYVDLCGMGSHKPFECVGYRDESLLALHLASRRRGTRPLHSKLVAILPDTHEVEALRKRFLEAYNEENGLPSHWNDLLRGLVAAQAQGGPGGLS